MNRESATSVRTEFVEAGDRTIAYRSVGEGKPLILCNRFRGTLDTWDPAFIDALTDSFRVITYTYGGFGRSGGEPHTDVLTMAQEVKALAAALELPSFVLGGWSFGGMVAQTVFTEHPEVVSHLVLIGTTPPGSIAHPPEPAFFERALKPVNDLPDEEVLFFEPASEASRRAAKLSHDRIAARQEDLEAPMTKREWEFLLQAGTPFKEDKHHALDKLKAAAKPILIFSGDHEIVFPVENWYALTRALPTMQLHVFPQAGHGPHLQYPDTCAQYITTFVQTMKGTAWI